MVRRVIDLLLIAAILTAIGFGAYAVGRSVDKTSNNLAKQDSELGQTTYHRANPKGPSRHTFELVGGRDCRRGGDHDHRVVHERDAQDASPAALARDVAALRSLTRSSESLKSRTRSADNVSGGFWVRDRNSGG